MGQVIIKLGDIFEGGMDLTVLPCSAKGSISSSTERWTRLFGIGTPNELGLQIEHGGISSPIPFPKDNRMTRFVIYAASVFNKHTSCEIITSIGEKLGTLAASRPDMIHIESPLLGAGAGGLEPTDSGRSLCQGFLSTSGDKSLLFIFANDKAKCDAVSQAMSTGFAGRLWDAVEIAPGFGGVTVNIKKLLGRKNAQP